VKKRAHRDNRRRKKMVAQRKAARARAGLPVWPVPARFDATAQHRDERKFLLDVLQPLKAAIAQVLVPHLPAIFENVLKEIVELALDLIFDNGDEADPYAAVIRDVYGDGAEAALPHLDRAIQWRLKHGGG
jgi:hypothetical protein